MLLQAFVLLAALAVVSASLAAAAAGAVHASVERVALRAAAAALWRGQQAIVDAVAQQAQQGGTGAASSLSLTLAAVPACGPAAVSCPLTAEASIESTGSSGAATSGSARADQVQRRAGVDEHRIAVRVTATVRGGDGSVLAARTQLITLRTLAVPPYALVTGVLDAASGLAAQAEGDSAGEPGGDDTRIHALLVCRDGGSGACAGATPRPVDDYADQTWDAGTASVPGWMR